MFQLSSHLSLPTLQKKKADKMSPKVSAFCLIVFLLFFTLSCAAAARPEPASSVQYGTRVKPQHLDSEAEKVDLVEDSCEGIEEEEECLVRRTLAAHTDYIYTQKTKP